MVFEKIEYWQKFSIPIIEVDKLHYVSVNTVNDILNPIELHVNDEVYSSSVTKIFNTCLFSETGTIKNQGLELFVPIEKLNKFISAK